MIDMYRPIAILSIPLGLYLITVRRNKETPTNGITSTERGLTTTDSESIEEAVMQNTTHPQGRHSLTQNSGNEPASFVWIIAAVRRDCPTVKATIHHIAAATECEARRMLAKDHVCFFAGRIRQGVSNA
ncbi:host cell division inhibitor Icd-like protein [Tatumella sp. JGM16]|nr:host cell division inhibitor Icd-like protein [Tatumella sp. JGM16]MBS0911244.1 host cell division inhibitor Icd-like protein [Tatumella sp. JGM91]